MYSQSNDDFNGLHFVDIAKPKRQLPPIDNGIQHLSYSDKQIMQAEKELYYPSETNLLRNGNQARYCGLKRRTFWIVLVVVVLVVVIAAVGGGVGSSMASKSNGTTSADTQSKTSTTASGTPTTLSSSPTASTSPTTSSTSSTLTSMAPAATGVTIPEDGIGEYDCPAQNNTSYTPSMYPFTFEVLCNVDWSSNVPGVNGGNVTNLNRGVIANSIQACVDQCAANRAGGGPCTAVAYSANITMQLLRGGITGNCFMKDQRGVVNKIDTSYQLMAAYLTSG